jgi:hypothetical protein
MDMGLTQIEKYFKDMDIITTSVDSGDSISLEYQRDNDIGSDAYSKAGTIWSSPVGKVEVNEGGVRNMRYRINVEATDLHNTPVINALVAKMFARSPVSRQWNVRCRVSNIRRNGGSIKWSDMNALYRWLWNAAKSSERLWVHTTIGDLDDIQVVVEPPSWIRESLGAFGSIATGQVTFILREV